MGSEEAFQEIWKRQKEVSWCLEDKVLLENICVCLTLDLPHNMCQNISCIGQEAREHDSKPVKRRNELLPIFQS